MTLPAFKPFNSFEINDLNVDYHIHSTWTDGQATVEQIVNQMKKKGLRQIAITDHVRRSSDYFWQSIPDIKSIAEKNNVRILIGFEAKVIDYDGNIDIVNACRQQSDFVIGSVHSIPLENGFARPESFPFNELQLAEHKLALALIRAKQADVLGHAGGMSMSLYQKFDLNLLKDLVKACAEFGRVFEINARYHGHIIDWLIETLQYYNPMVSIGSDAHHLEDIGKICSLLSDRIGKK